MGDAPLAYAETVGGVKVSEDDPVAVGKNDVSNMCLDGVWCRSNFLHRCCHSRWEDELLRPVLLAIFCAPNDHFPLPVHLELYALHGRERE